MPDDRHLEQRLRAYESRVPEADPPDLTARRGASPWRTVIAGGAAAAAIGAGVLAVALLNAIRSDDLGPSPSPATAPSTAASAPPESAASDAAEASAPATPTTAQTHTPVPSVEAEAWTWTEGIAPEAWVSDVMWLGDRWLAVGASGTRAGSWTSQDGLSWQPGAPIGPENQIDSSGISDRYRMQALIRFNDEIFAFGVRAYGCCDGIEGAMWRSSDGVAWEFVNTSGSEYQAWHSPVDAAVAPTGELVVVSGTQLGSGTSIYTSPDGTTWQEHVLTEAAGGAMYSVAASDTMLVGVGSGFAADSRPLVWRSVDGRTWREVPAPQPNGALRAITWDAERGQFVASGADEAGRPTIWLSRDAVSWSPVTLSEQVGEVSEIAAENGAMIAIGGTGAHPSFVATAWTSLDGSAWASATLASNAGQPATGIHAEGAVVWLHLSTGEPDYRPFMEVWVAR